MTEKPERERNADGRKGLFDVADRFHEVFMCCIVYTLQTRSDLFRPLLSRSSLIRVGTQAQD